MRKSLMTINPMLAIYLPSHMAKEAVAIRGDKKRKRFDQQTSHSTKQRKRR